MRLHARCARRLDASTLASPPHADGVQSSHAHVAARTAHLCPCSNPIWAFTFFLILFTVGMGMRSSIGDIFDL
ncbi:hypothetical protein AXF42_Ash014892 [Apostasia shenzhenica]|uniref:Uncharacterized protein n=1 Tax=Apostasia shenzhenica TaxID=1088818 RepID=A0A2I0ALF5_9ASPA|nr:hypothetical protein AXF42_Ash014892 [Apostasia shenzhenica]